MSVEATEITNDVSEPREEVESEGGQCTLECSEECSGECSEEQPARFCLRQKILEFWNGAITGTPPETTLTFGTILLKHRVRRIVSDKYVAPEKEHRTKQLGEETYQGVSVEQITEEDRKAAAEALAARNLAGEMKQKLGFSGDVSAAQAVRVIIEAGGAPSKKELETINKESSYNDEKLNDAIKASYHPEDTQRYLSAGIKGLSNTPKDTVSKSRLEAVLKLTEEALTDEELKQFFDLIGDHETYNIDQLTDLLTQKMQAV